MSLTIVGTVAFDELITPFASSGRIIGGSATYAGISASYFSKDVKLVSIIGEDFPEEKLQMMRNRNINIDGVHTVEGGKSFFWKGKYHNDMNSRDSLETELNVLADFDPVLPEESRTSEFLLLGNLTPQVQLKVLEQMKSRPKMVALDTMNFWMDVAWDDLLKVLKHVDLLTINDEEARQLSGEYSLVKAAKKIATMGPKTLVIKKGEHGALLFRDDQVFFAPALPLEEVFDPTGAGDTFAGGMMGYLAKTEDISFENLKRSILFGSAMASFCVEQFGTEKTENLSQEEIQQRLHQFINLTQVELELA